MGCRYCGKELALLKRLTGGGEFCSEAHKQSYQDEYNRLALSRLLQAQKVSHAESPGKKAGTASAAPVAVEEPAPEKTPLAEPTLEATSSEENTLEERLEIPPVMESAPLEISSLEGFGTGETAIEDTAAEATLEPSEIAEFLIDSPAMATLPDETPYL